MTATDTKWLDAGTVECHIGNKLKNLRRKRGLSRARVDGITRQPVGTCKMLEQGKAFMGSTQLYSLSKAFGVDPSCFFDGLPSHTLSTKQEPGRRQEKAQTQETKDLIKAFVHINDPDLRRTIIGLINAVASDPSYAENITPLRRRNMPPA